MSKQSRPELENMKFEVAREMGVPVKYVGVGEGMDDLMEFDPDAFVDALFLREE